MTYRKPRRSGFLALLFGGLAVGSLSVAAAVLQRDSSIPLAHGNSPLSISTFVTLLLGSFVAAAIAWRERQAWVHSLLWLSSAVGLLWLGIGEVTGSFIRISQFWDDDYRYKVPFWIAAALGLYVARRSSSISRHALHLLEFGFVLQSASNFLDMADGDLFTLPILSPYVIDFATEVSELVFSEIYALALIAILVSRSRPGHIAISASDRTMVNGAAVESRNAFQAVKSMIKGRQFKVWQSENFGRPSSEFYVAHISSAMIRGKRHAALLVDYSVLGSFSPKSKALGQAVFDHLCEQGLRRNQSCVDYGCGSLRIGQFLIDYLDPDMYVGLDVTDAFYSAGLKLLDPELVARKRPILASIDSNVLAALHRAPPDHVLSFAVIQHVAPSDLGEFCKNIAQLIGPNTRGYLYFKRSPTIRQFKTASWSYPAEFLAGKLLAELPARKLIIACDSSPAACRVARYGYSLIRVE